VVGRAGLAADAAVVDVGVDVDLAAVGLLIGVAVGEAGVAGAAAHAGGAGRGGDVVGRALPAAAAAVVGIGGGEGLAAVGELVVVAVGVAQVADAVAQTRGARRGGVAVGADLGAAAAVERILGRVDLAAVIELVVVAVEEAG